MEESILRVIDANANRAREGLRVLEDVARFILDDEDLTASAKACRHRITRLAGMLKETGRSFDEFRDSETDVGRYRSVEGEKERAEVRDVLLANARRVQEALRVLEEFTKLTDAEIALELKDLRYSVYTLEKTMVERLEAGRRAP